MNKHNYLMALAMNSDVGTLHLSDTEIPVKVVEVESDTREGESPMTTFKCLVVNDDQIKRLDRLKEYINSRYGVSIITRSGRYPGCVVDPMKIKKVIFSNPVTVVLWADGTKTIVRCQEGDTYSKETGLALCFAKKALGNKGNFNDVFHEWIPEDEESL